jgi:hypothetical protein
MPGIAEVKRRHEAELLGRPGVVGVGLGRHGGRDCIMVLLSKRDAKVEAGLPRELEGYPVLVEIVGDVRPWR